MNASIITLVLAVVIAADTQPVKPQAWQNPVLWQKIKAGQTPEQVSRTLGDPAATESSNAIEAWFYADVPQTGENGQAIRPKHGFLIFRKTPTGSTLQKWVEPDWQTMLTWAQLQNDYKKAIAEQKAAARAQLMEERKQQAEQAAAERAEKQKALAEARKQRMTKPIQTKTDTSAEFQEQEKAKHVGQQSSWLIDNIMIIAAVLGFIVFGAIFVYQQYV